MTFIKILLFPLAVCVALLVAESGLSHFDEYWSGTPGGGFSGAAIGFRGEGEIAAHACMSLLCSLVAPASDDDDDDD
jgi:hypothetical protein